MSPRPHCRCYFSTFGTALLSLYAVTERDFVAVRYWSCIERTVPQPQSEACFGDPGMHANSSPLATCHRGSRRVRRAISTMWRPSLASSKPQGKVALTEHTVRKRQETIASLLRGIESVLTQ
jgi:hypothetical protein